MKTIAPESEYRILLDYDDIEVLLRRGHVVDQRIRVELVCAAYRNLPELRDRVSKLIIEVEEFVGIPHEKWPEIHTFDIAWSERIFG
jgi:hypothetical protein